MKTVLSLAIVFAFLAGCGQPPTTIKAIEDPVTVKIVPQPEPQQPKFLPDKVGTDSSDLLALTAAMKKNGWKIPKLSPSSCAVDQVGTVPRKATVVSVTGNFDAVIEWSLNRGFWLTEYPTTNFTDEQQIDLRGVMIVQGRHQYKAVNGATITVFVLRPVSDSVVDEAKKATESLRQTDSAYPSK